MADNKKYYYLKLKENFLKAMKQLYWKACLDGLIFIGNIFAQAIF
ncbi:Uncharacterised protein [Streptococcus agalactiae]|uniref:Uncharacterized protein n=1 Tax=Streptococcus agalactiae TaxID=1311 RepID=A0A7Z7KBV3_STRAG|nr:Uncharacterised protein [Streptococcus agalactiae]